MKPLRLDAAMFFFFLSVVVIPLSSCRTVKPEVPVHGLREEVSVLTGVWRGEYGSVEANRHGVISFELEAQADSAYGYVIMMPGKSDDAYFDDFKAAFNNVNDLLTIRFVSVGMGRIVGRLDEYRDPVCGCLLETTFEGHINEDRIEGVYVTHGEGFHVDTTGNWWVERISSAVANREE